MIFSNEQWIVDADGLRARPESGIGFSFSTERLLETIVQDGQVVFSAPMSAAKKPEIDMELFAAAFKEACFTLRPDLANRRLIYDSLGDATVLRSKLGIG